jgi:hypothetical protein
LGISKFWVEGFEDPLGEPLEGAEPEDAVRRAYACLQFEV